MYREFYGLKEPPFSITPDPRFVFLSERHRDALAHLLYGVGKGGSGGFVQLTGEVGTGKTTLCRLLLEQLPENTHVALLLNPKLSPLELLEATCEELKIDLSGKRGSSKALVDALNAYLLEAYAQGQHIVLIVDEAQSLSIDALEQVRLLTNLETSTQKLLQVILLGQPELRDILLKAELRQLAQRITARYHLTPLDGEETEAYLRHRMAVAGAQRFPFSRLAVRALHRRAGGVPRLLNVIAERALMAGYARERDVIGERLVSRAADEALAGGARRLVWYYALPAVLVIAALLGAWFERERWWAAPTAPPAPTLPSIAPAPVQTSAQLSDWLEQSRDSELIAWTSLLARWQVSTEVSVSEAARCNPVLFAGLNCLRGAGNLDKLQVLNRPVILLLDGSTDPAYALLLGVGRKQVKLKLAGKNFSLTRNDFAAHWSGNYLALWRQAEFVPTNLKRGDAGPAVAWLKDRLDRLDPQPDRHPGPAFFDASLEQRVRALQVAYGLVADGIVGPDTLFALAALDDTGPHLEREVP